MTIKPNYFLYARKSTEDDDKQVMSIEAQLFELREFARKENLEILKEFQESKSAKTPGRAIFGEIMSRIESGEAQGIIAWHPDRLARNSIDGGRVIYAVDTGKVVSLRFPTFWFEPTPQGLFMLQVAFGQSKYFSDNLVQNVKRGIRQKLRRGEWLTKAPFGYVNNPRTRNIEPHPVNSKIVVRAFEEYLKGTHGLVSLSQFLADLGVVCRTGSPLSKCAIRHLLSNRAYLGFVRHYDEWFDGTFVPIVPPSLFEAVQKILASKGRTHKRKHKHTFPFLGIFRCGECGGMFTAQHTKGNGGMYRHYRCTKKHGTCSQRYVQESELVRQIQDRLQTISLCDAYCDWMLDEVKKWENSDVSASHSVVQQGNNWVEPLREWILDTKQATFLSSSDNFAEIASFVKKVGTNHTIRDKTARLVVSAPSNFVAQRRRIFAPTFCPARSRSDLTEREVSFCAPGRNRTHIFPLGRDCSIH